MKEYGATVYQRVEHVAYIMGFESNDVSDDETYVANLRTSEIAVLKGPSAVIWEALDEPQTADGIIAEIQQIYDVPLETVTESVLNFLDSLVQKGLLATVYR